MKDTSRAFNIFVAILLGIIGWGGYNIFLLFTKGAGITGSSDVVPWGIYIVGFVFFVGASAGATIIGLMIHAFYRNDYKPLGLRAILIGLLSLIAAVLNLIMDVGVPLRTLLIPWVLRNMTSMLIYTSTTYFIFGFIFLAKLYHAVEIARGSTANIHIHKKMEKWLAIISVPFALIVLHAPHGALFAVVKAREYWHTPLLPPHFAVSALVTGTAIMILVPIITSKASKREIVGRETLDHLGKLLAFFITVNIFFDFFDIFVLMYSDEPEGIETLNLLTGRFLPLFILNFAGLFVSLFILLTKRGRTVTGLSIATTVTLSGIIAYRYNLVVVAQTIPLLPGLPEIYYYPTFPEVSIEAGIVAFALFLYTVLTRVLPLGDTVPGAG